MSRVIFLRPGEQRTINCGGRGRRTIRIRRNQILVIICRVTRRRFIFVCGRIRRPRIIVRRVSGRVTVRCSR